MATQSLTTKPIARETVREGGVNEVQEVAVDGTGGTFTLSYDGDATGNLAFNISAENLEAALESLDSVPDGSIKASGGPGNSGATTPYSIEFVGALAQQPVETLVADDTNLTGGGSAVTVTVETEGEAGRIVAQHLTDVVTDPESEDAVQMADPDEYPSANQTNANPLSVHGEPTPEEVFAE